MKNSNDCEIGHNRMRSIASFLKKTYDMLNDPQNLPYLHWSPTGIGFIIKNQEQFSKIVLPRYFKHSNYSSFVRQLNMYNFHKVRQNSNENYFHHEHFDKNDRSALSEIKRKPQKKKKGQVSEEEDAQSQNEKNIKTKKIAKDKRQQKQERQQRKISINNILKQIASEQKCRSQKITHHIFQQQNCKSQEVLGYNESSNHLSMLVEQDEKQQKQRLPRLATNELICESKNNLFPISIDNVQNSNLSIFY